MQEFLDLLLGPAGATALLVFAVVSGWRGWWVFGWHYREVAKERDEWKEAALRALSGAESAAQIGQTLAEHARGKDKP